MASSAALLQSTVGNILGLGATAAEQSAQATAQGYAAQGDAAEQQAYLNAQLIANQNAATEEMAGRLEKLQTDREVAETVGKQRANIASSGFQESGTFLSGLQSSYKQAALSKQLIDVQTSLTQGGYEAQGAAAQGEAAAAGFANNAALALQKASSDAATTSVANQAAETRALMGYLKLTDPTMSNPETQLATATINPNLNPNAPVDTSGTGFNWMTHPDGTVSFGAAPTAGINPLGVGNPGVNPLMGAMKGL